MSIEQAQAFMEKVKNDQNLAKRFNEAEDNESKLKIAKELGYDFSIEDVRQAYEKLDDDELQNVAGGMKVDFGFDDGKWHLNIKS